MTLTQAQATFGLRAFGTPTGTNISNDVQIGIAPTTVAFPNAEVAYSVGCLLADSTADFVINLADGDTTGTTAWTAGTAQVETATAAGTITGSGNAEVIVTAAGMTGSPKTILVAVENGDTAAVWAGKVRTALAADTAVAALFDVSGTSTSIVLTRKPSKTYTIGATILPIRVANDSTLNIELDNDTSTGITPAASSANTTAGVATVGAYLFDGDGKDFEGVTIPTIGDISGYLIQNLSSSAGDINISGANYSYPPINSGQTMLRAHAGSGSSTLTDELTIEATSSAYVTVTVIGAE